TGFTPSRISSADMYLYFPKELYCPFGAFSSPCALISFSDRFFFSAMFYFPPVLFTVFLFHDSMNLHFAYPVHFCQFDLEELASCVLFPYLLDHFIRELGIMAVLSASMLQSVSVCMIEVF